MNRLIYIVVVDRYVNAEPIRIYSGSRFSVSDCSRKGLVRNILKLP